MSGQPGASAQACLCWPSRNTNPRGVCRHRDERSMLGRKRNGKSQDELRDLCLLMDR